MTYECRDVLGEPLRSTTDLVLHHEHIFCDTAFTHEASDDPATKLTIAAADLDDVRRRPRAYADNLRMEGEIVQAEVELIPTRAPAIIDVTLDEIGRSPANLRALAEKTNAQFFMGCGHYVEKVRADKRVRESAFYCDEILFDLLEGIEGVRAAVIGEIGASNPVTALEEATLRGAIQAQLQTGAPLLVHIPGWNPNALEVIDLLSGEGADPSRTLICHLDWSLGTHDLGYQIAVLERGFLIGFDTWGDELSYSGNQQPSDDLRISSLLKLADLGFGDQILHSNDISTKTQLARFGGPGYHHLPRVVFPRLREGGLSDADIERLFLAPALRFLMPASASGSVNGRPATG